MDFKSIGIQAASCFGGDKAIDMLMPLSGGVNQTGIFLRQGLKGASARVINDLANNYLNGVSISPSTFDIKGIAVSAGANIATMMLLPKIIPFESGSLTYYGAMFAGQYIGKMLENKYLRGSGVTIQPAPPAVNRLL